MTPKEQWTAVDRYLGESVNVSDSALDEALRASAASGLPSINVSPLQGKFLQLLARVRGARKILEIGTLGAYSTIWLGRALPAGGKLITLESKPAHAAVARENLARAGLSDVVDLRLGPALETLKKIESEGYSGDDGFDLVFIDADKPSTADYFNWALRLTHPGSVIVVDNVVREGKVLDAASTDASVQGIRRFLEALAAEKRVDATALQTVGPKGHDGFVVALVTASI